MFAAPAAFGGDLETSYDELTLSPATPQGITICHGFGCRDRTEIAFSAADRARMAAILSGGHGSPAAERRAIAVAVAWLDRRVGPQAGTSHHVARGGLKQMDNPSAQFDCIDASRNTTSLLQVLDAMRLLRHHRVDEPEARGAFIDGRWPHATAVVAEKTSHVKWSIDSWTRAAGQQPEVMPLARWLTLR